MDIRLQVWEHEAEKKKASSFIVSFCQFLVFLTHLSPLAHFSNHFQNLFLILLGQKLALCSIFWGLALSFWEGAFVTAHFHSTFSLFIYGFLLSPYLLASKLCQIPQQGLCQILPNLTLPLLFKLLLQDHRLSKCFKLYKTSH